jgi:hypothetical protein
LGLFVLIIGFCFFQSCRFLVKKCVIYNGLFHLLVKDGMFWTFTFFLYEVSLKGFVILGLLRVFRLAC